MHRKEELKLTPREDIILKKGLLMGGVLVMIGFGLGLVLFKFVFRLI